MSVALSSPLAHNQCEFSENIHRVSAKDHVDYMCYFNFLANL